MPDRPLTDVLQRLESPATPDPAFASALLADLEPRVRGARRTDASMAGRLLRIARRPNATVAPTPRIAVMTVLVLAALLLAVVAWSAGTRHQPARPFLSWSTSTAVGSTETGFVAEGTVRLLGPGDRGLVPGQPLGGWRQSTGGSISPDGRYAVVATGYGSFEVHDLGAGPATQVEFDLAGTFDWAPDGSLAWTGYETRARSDETHVAAAGILRPGASEPAYIDLPAGQVTFDAVWSPDGRQLAVLTEELGAEPTRGQLLLVDPGTLHARSFPDLALAGGVAWLPDGHVLANRANGDESAGIAGDLLSIDTVSGRSTVLARAAWAETAVTTPDGQWILATVVSATGTDVWRIASDGTDARRLASGALATRSAHRRQVSSDGRWVLVTTREPATRATDDGGTARLWRVSTVDGRAEPVADGVWPNSAEYAPDGDAVVYATGPVVPEDAPLVSFPAIDPTVMAQSKIWLARPDGSDPRVIVDGSATYDW